RRVRSESPSAQRLRPCPAQRRYESGFRIGLIELTRVIERFDARIGTVRTGAYRAATDTEDGYESVP
ncbi:MAG: hypothetical protein RLZZ162_3961, partial [Verrucomicrobiota bacterium]